MSSSLSQTEPRVGGKPSTNMGATATSLPVQEIGGKMLVGQSPAFLHVIEQVRTVAALDVTVLLLGERGTGKSTVAQIIHALSVRASAPYHELNCATMPELLIESELFGSVKGAFSDAKDRKGLFQEASGGTLFLDEIGDMSQPLQANLLRVVETGNVKRLGSNKTESCDVRLICATNKDLRLLRADFVDRIDQARIILPPLRERKEDLPALIKHGFLIAQQKIARKTPFVLDQLALTVLCGYEWPGNIRQLGNVILKIALTCVKSETILASDVGAVLRRRAADNPPPKAVVEIEDALVQNQDVLLRAPEYQAGEPLDHYFARVLVTMYANLFELGGLNHSQIARTLGIDRATLYSRLKSARSLLGVNETSEMSART